MNRCPECDEWRFESLPHKCPPRFLVWADDEDIEDAAIVYASDAEEAATKACDQWDSDGGDGPLEHAVYVKPEEAKDWEATKYHVSYEHQVVYTACIARH